LRALRTVLAVACGWSAAALGLPFDHAYWIAASSRVVKVEVARGGSGYSLGTGVVVARGLVATACHVLRGGTAIGVTHAGTRYSATARIASADRDVCLLRVPRLDARPAVLRPTAELAFGEEVAAIGLSAGGGVFRTRGEVSRLYRYDEGTVVQCSAAFTSGASGGGLFDTNGRLVGMLMFRMRGPGAQYFAIPVEWFTDRIGDEADDSPGSVTISADPFWSRTPQRLPYFMRANMLESEAQWEALRALALQWRAAEPANPEPAFVLGELDRRGDRQGAALAEFREAVERDPAHALAWCGMVRALMRLNDPVSARRAYEKLALLSAALSGRMASEFPEAFK
jgi:hypothetical protein